MSGGRQLLAPTLHDEDKKGTDTTVYHVERFGAQSPSQLMQLLGLLDVRGDAKVDTNTAWVWIELVAAKGIPKRRKQWKYKQ